MIRTLIVDDDPFVRMSLQTILEAQDDVEVCALGADGAGLDRIRVTLHETDLARASYEGALA